LGLVGSIGRRAARRSRWLAERLWVIAALEVAWMANRHWRLLEPEERKRLIELAKKSKGRPSRLSARERQEADVLLNKLEYAALGGDVARTVIPFRPVGRLVEFALGRAARRRPGTDPAQT
jgi:hypothetical protein